MKNFTLKRSFTHLILLILFSLSASNISGAGVFDESFGTNGTARIPFDFDLRVTDLAFQHDGKFVISATALKVIRVNADGTLDTTFGTNGIVSTQGIANSILVLDDGKILVAGTIGDPNQSPANFYLERFNSDGSIDKTFGNNGVVSINQSAGDTFREIKTQSDGKIIAIGSHNDGGFTGVAIRFNPDGTLDSSFADGGFFYFPLVTDNITQSRGFFDVEIFKDNKILLSATEILNFPGQENDTTGYLLLMLDSNGEIFTDFGNNGFVNHRIFGAATFADSHIELLNNDKILVSHYSGVHVLNNNGSLSKALPYNGAETSLLPNGRILVTTGNPSNSPNLVGQIKLYSENNFIGKANNLAPKARAFAQPDGKILITGDEFFPNNDLILQRLNLISSQATRSPNFDLDDKADFGIYDGQAINVQKSTNITVSNLQVGSFAKVIPELYELASNNTGFIFRRLITIYNRGVSSDFPGRYFVKSESNSVFFDQPWGIVEDIPVGGDFSGNGSNDLTVFRPSDGIWYSIHAPDIKWGITGDKPVPADYDYDGITDHAIYRPTTGQWWIRRSSDGGSTTIQFGIETDIPLTGDYDGDGFADLSVYRPSEGNWYQYLTTEGFRVIRFGLKNDYPVPGDYDGDGKHDVAVYRDGTWYLLQSTEGFKVVQFGTANDTPISVRYDE